MNEDEFRLLKVRLTRALAELSKADQMCPELDLQFAIARVQAARAECWKFGPPAVQKRQIKHIVAQQPYG